MMILIAAAVAAYIAVALLCVYLDARFDSESTPEIWTLWPMIIPIMVVIFLFEYVRAVGEHHRIK